MPKTGGGRFRGMNCATSKTRHLAPTFASHGFQRKQANVDCQSGWVNSERSLYRPSSTRHASKRTLISTERASGRQKERAKAIIQLRDLLQVPWGAGLPERILCFSTRGLVPDRRREESTQTVLSWDVAAEGGRIERWARGSSGTWRILGDLRLATCLLSRCTARLASRQDGCDVDKRGHPSGVGRLGGGTWWRIMDEPSEQPPDSL